MFEVIFSIIDYFLWFWYSISWSFEIFFLIYLSSYYC